METSYMVTSPSRQLFSSSLRSKGVRLTQPYHTSHEPELGSALGQDRSPLQDRLNVSHTGKGKRPARSPQKVLAAPQFVSPPPIFQAPLLVQVAALGIVFGPGLAT
jgi:hypothetical protein